MEGIFYIAAIISTVYFIAKFIEMRFIEKESKPLKFLIRDSLLVYFSVIIGNFVVEQLKPVIDEVEGSNVPTEVFKGEPAF